MRPWTADVSIRRRDQNRAGCRGVLTALALAENLCRENNWIHSSAATEFPERYPPVSALQCHCHNTDLSLRQLGHVSVTRKMISFPGFDVSGFLAMCRQTGHQIGVEPSGSPLGRKMI